MGLSTDVQMVALGWISRRRSYLPVMFAGGAHGKSCQMLQSIPNILSAVSPSAVVVPGQCAVLSRDGALVSTSGCIQDVSFSYKQRAHQPGVNRCAKHLPQENVMFI